MDWWFDIFRHLRLAPNTALTWEWVIGVFIIVMIVVALGTVLSMGIKLLIVKALKTTSHWDDVLLKSLKFPLTLLFWIIGLSYAVELVWELDRSSRLLAVSSGIRSLGIILCWVFFLLRFLTLGEAAFLENKKKQGKSIDTAGIRVFNKILKASVIITAVLMTLNTLGVSVSGILAFGGIGGIAVGFAAKDLLSNFFGGVMVYLDRPFIEGEWIRSPDRNIEGTVEYIGWRQTCIRAFDRHPIYVPNSVFAQITIENRSRMECRRILETIGVRYDDMSKVEKITTDIKSMLKTHEEVSDERTLIVSLNEFSASSVDIMVNAYTKVTDWEYFHGVKQDIMLKISRIIEENGGEIAYPTRTLHLSNNLENRK